MQSSLQTGRIGGLFAQYCVSSVLGMLGISLYILADTFFIANGVGQTALAALNLVLPAYSVIQAMGLMLGIGGAAYASVQRGMGNAAQGNRMLTFGVCWAALLGLAIALLGTLAARPICLALGAGGDTLPHCVSYLRIVTLFAPMFILNQVLLAFVRNDHGPRLAMLSMLSGSFFNIVMDYVLVFPAGLGMGGAALATAFSPVVGIAVLLLHFRSPRCTTRLERKWPPLRLWLQVLRGGAASFITEMASGTVLLLFNLTLLPLAGNLGVAAYGIIANIVLVFGGIFTGVGQAIQPLVSVNFGAGQSHRMRQALSLGGVTAVALGLFGVACGLLWAPQITALFNRGNDPALSALAIPGIRLYFLCLPLMGLNLVVSAYLQSVLQLQASTVLSLGRGLIFIALFVTVLSRLWGVSGVWLAPLFAEACALLVATLLMCRGRASAAA